MIQIHTLLWGWARKPARLLAEAGTRSMRLAVQTDMSPLQKEDIDASNRQMLFAAGKRSMLSAAMKRRMLSADAGLGNKANRGKKASN